MTAHFSATELSNQTKSRLVDISHWGPWCDVTLTLKQALQSDYGAKIFLDEHQCKRAFRYLMNLLNRAVYGNTVKLHGKRLRVLPVVEKGEVRVRSLPARDRNLSGRWHIHCAIELPQHMGSIA